MLQGTYSYVLQNDAGQVAATHSVSAGLDYASVGPEHAMLHDSGRATYTSATDDEALDAVRVLSRTEGIIPALETAHAVAEAIKMAPKMGKDKILMVNVSGRGDKDIGIMTREMDLSGFRGEGMMGYAIAVAFGVILCFICGITGKVPLPMKRPSLIEVPPRGEPDRFAPG